MNIPNFKLFPNPVQIELSQIAFPIIVLLEDDRTDFVQEERLGLPYWTMISSICVVVDVSKYLDILTLKFSITSVHIFHFDLGKSGYCFCCLRRRQS